MPSLPHQRPADADIVQEFRAQADVTDGTRIKYTAHLAEFSRWLRDPRSATTGDSGLVGATKAEVVRHMAYLMAGDRYAAGLSPRAAGPLAAASRKSVLGSLSAFYRYLLSVGLVNVNPVEGIPRPRPSYRPGLTLTAVELRRLLDVRSNPRDRVQVFLLAYTAARAGELRNLRWRDVDLVGRTLTFHGKGSRHRVVDIHPLLMTELRRWFLYLDHIATRNPAIKEAMSSPDADYVLLTRTGRQLWANAICTQLKRRAVLAGLHELPSAYREYRSLVSPHTLRRSFATLLLNDGHHLDAVADVLGHDSLDTTRRHYAFSSNARRRATIEAFNV